MTDDINLQDWIGRSETAIEVLRPFPADALAATLDRDETYPTGAALPPLWHWLYFLPLHKFSESGRDGHAAKGGFLPPVPLPRRMWAGSRFIFHAPLKIGAEIRKRSTVAKVDPKQGRSGPLCFVTVAHGLYDGETLCIAEEHDIVYREEAAPGAPAPEPKAAPDASDFSREIHPGPVLLFRYSALTFNGHRIHYDRPYTTEVEGYGGLVVHGPLLATLLMDLLRREMPDATVRRFEFRALATILDTDDFSVHGARRNDGSIRLWVRRHDGALAMDATTTLA
ncbi:MaoC family dehydratase N-terminal domain-containing protein [Paracoccus sp. Z118]|uniref:FAS1-like dehydratase domain-containing protein n=1 Tax=Paracoccus sp. Z118 TaxID=2851017 RepID=UPI001C2C6C3C|nr:MaoC family dehydratase N-terminal domain-containing protein [Paracoccus sp. Z118]MBV0892385.1 MaoC family dehydratase N-terminal domain-containing protein [Paracoccus sp. Z118]